MELHQLTIFESVSRHLNMTSAAKELGTSQPTVSLQLKQLETECGLQFYVRDNHGVQLTQEGMAFLGAIQPILSQLEKIDLEFKKGRQNQASRAFIVGGSNTLSATVLPELVVEFSRKNPKVKLLVETGDSDTIASLVENRKVEIGIVTKPSQISGCACEPYLEHEAVAFVPPDHPLLGRTLTLEEFCKIRLVIRRGSSTISELERLGYRPRIGVQFGAIEAVKTAVAGGMGVGLLFRSRLESELRMGRFGIVDVPELKSVKLKSFIIFSKRPRLSANARKFLEVLHVTQKKPE